MCNGVSLAILRITTPKQLCIFLQIVEKQFNITSVYIKPFNEGSHLEFNSIIIKMIFRQSESVFLGTYMYGRIQAKLDHTLELYMYIVETIVATCIVPAHILLLDSNIYVYEKPV